MQEEIRNIKDISLGFATLACLSDQMDQILGELYNTEGYVSELN